jgi:hypothetical protein
MRAAKVDGNHPAIVDGLRKYGCTVQSLATIGKGCPDILVGWRCENFLFEIKDPSQPKNKRTLTDDQFLWHSNWSGNVFVIESLADAIELLNDVA